MEVLLFGIAREIAGAVKISFSAEERPATVAELKTFMCKKYPAFKRLSSMAVAVDAEYADDNTALSTANEVALIPPVSGG